MPSPSPEVRKALLDQLDILVRAFEREGLKDDDPDLSNAEFDPEAIEIAIDKLVMNLTNGKHLSAKELGRDRSLEAVFTQLYGAKAPILRTVKSFEGNIKGYFDAVSYEEMRDAYADIVKVKDFVAQHG